ncbi:hypothetical protein Q2T42_25760 [Leptolyngbya boryana CZ1]|uniref:Uncharacterized protein n=1 Tax=Leptolyngbya boryana CZ1 TaxID=3060204 RepID=A0AA96WTC6_LEPBY|nr:hypothetical protein [Leptolyngbya boryana]WNZ45197.1 hypothetical protein Q2T42_25760 [Leptolyngbya boryana CZ1]
MLSLQTIPVPVKTTEPTCSRCRHYDRGLCRLKAEADWDDSAKTSPTRKACYFASLIPF